MRPRTTCPACAAQDLKTLYQLPAIPAQSVVLLDSREEALGYPQGELTLTLCQGCGLLFNATFDAGLVDYAANTEESQHFSGTFNRFAVELAAELAGRQDLEGKLVLEIGCGKGDFLMELVEQTGARAIGVDPGFINERLIGEKAQSIEFIRGYFDPAQIEETPDLILCRHTLEHIPEVGQFLADITRITNDNPECQVMFETPDVARVLEEGAFWDIYHEHCSYFTIGSHARLLRRSGLNVTQSYLAYQGQYIIQYAQLGAGLSRPDEQDLDQILALARVFPDKVEKTRAVWTERVREAHSLGQRIAIWGGGSKAVAFLTTNQISSEVSQVVDINRYKQGKYLPSTGHLVLPPEALKAAPPDLIMVMNPIYLNEIREHLCQMGLAPSLVAI